MEAAQTARFRLSSVNRSSAEGAGSEAAGVEGRAFWKRREPALSPPGGQPTWTSGRGRHLVRGCQMRDWEEVRAESLELREEQAGSVPKRPGGGHVL